MYCPICGVNLPENIAFCPKCGGKLPKIEKMGVDPDKLNLEQASGAAKSGFDTGKPFFAKDGGQIPPIQEAPVKKKPNALAVLLAIIAIIIACILLFKNF